MPKVKRGLCAKFVIPDLIVIGLVWDVSDSYFIFVTFLDRYSTFS
jgi:hypothetical protein